MSLCPKLRTYDANRRFLLVGIGALFIQNLVTASICAESAYVPLDELVKYSELIVVGRLSNVTTYTLDEIDYGRGVIAIQRTLWGNPPEEGAVALQWRNHSRLICPRVEHSGNAGGTFIWLLNIDADGYAHAGGQDCLSLSSEAEVLGYIKSLKSTPKSFFFPIPAATLARPHKEYVFKRRLLILFALSAIGIAIYGFQRFWKKVPAEIHPRLGDVGADPASGIL